VAGTLALLVPIAHLGVGSWTVEDVPVAAPHGRIGKGWVGAKLDGGINEGGVTTGGINRDWVTSELGRIAEWARERGGDDKHGGDGADNIEVGGFD
jgi:hypothetical protein